MQEVIRRPRFSVIAISLIVGALVAALTVVGLVNNFTDDTPDYARLVPSPEIARWQVGQSAVFTLETSYHEVELRVHTAAFSDYGVAPGIGVGEVGVEPEPEGPVPRGQGCGNYQVVQTAGYNYYSVWIQPGATIELLPCFETTATLSLHHEGTQAASYTVTSSPRVTVYDTADIDLDFMEDPLGIAWDGTHYWVVDRIPDVMRAFQRDGQRLHSWDFALYSNNTNPIDLAWDGKYLRVLDSGQYRIYTYQRDGTYVPGSDISVSGVPIPRGVAWAGQLVFVIGAAGNADNRKAYAYALSGTPTPSSDIDIRRLTKPHGIAWDGDLLHVVNNHSTDEDEVHVWDLSGAYRGLSWHTHPGASEALTYNGFAFAIIERKGDVHFYSPDSLRNPPQRPPSPPAFPSDQVLRLCADTATTATTTADNISPSARAALLSGAETVITVTASDPNHDDITFRLLPTADWEFFQVTTAGAVEVSVLGGHDTQGLNIGQLYEVEIEASDDWAASAPTTLGFWLDGKVASSAGDGAC